MFISRWNLVIHGEEPIQFIQVYVERALLSIKPLFFLGLCREREVLHVRCLLLPPSPKFQSQPTWTHVQKCGRFLKIHLIIFSKFGIELATKMLQIWFQFCIPWPKKKESLMFHKLTKESGIVMNMHANSYQLQIGLTFKIYKSLKLPLFSHDFVF
jgi:hypothetical protein